jgi:tRNA dimethylallyltransferase
MNAQSLTHRALYLTGPTAVGKTAVGVALARRLGAEILALDSMTLYRGMDIGTAKPSLKERGGIPHHLIDRLDPWESASVAMYRSWALEVLEDLASRGKPALFVGGTPLYLKAMLRGLFEGPSADLAFRQSLESEPDLHGRLAALDPATAARLHPSDRRRLIRALEVIHATGQRLSTLQMTHDRPAEGVCVFALERPRAELHDRINRRVLEMFEMGLVDEVRQLLNGPKPLHSVPAQGVGYREVIEHIAGRSTLSEAIARTQARTRQFAKRQATWFRGLAEVRMWPVAPDEPAEITAERLARMMGQVD